MNIIFSYDFRLNYEMQLTSENTTLSRTFINIRVPMIKKEIEVYAFVGV